MKNLILTSCTNYSSECIEHFLCSYRRFVPDTQLVVFGGYLPVSTRTAIEDVGGLYIDILDRYSKVSRFNVRIVKRIQRRYSTPLFRRIYRLAAAVDNLRYGSSNGLQFAVTGIMPIRWLEYSNYVAKLETEASILVTDIRDVIFQCNPFGLPLHGLELYQEENNIIGSCKYNFPWMQTIVGSKTAQKFMMEPVLCAGTTFGDLPSMRHYLDRMSRRVNNNQLPLGPMEQAYHNFLFYGGELSDIEAISVPNRTGRVQTLGRYAYVCDDGFIRNLDDSISPVVHQWDRFKELSSWADSLCMYNSSQ